MDNLEDEYQRLYKEQTAFSRAAMDHWVVRSTRRAWAVSLVLTVLAVPLTARVVYSYVKPPCESGECTALMQQIEDLDAEVAAGVVSLNESTAANDDLTAKVQSLTETISSQTNCPDLSFRDQSWHESTDKHGLYYAVLPDDSICWAEVGSSSTLCHIEGAAVAAVVPARSVAPAPVVAPDPEPTEVVITPLLLDSL